MRGAAGDAQTHFTPRVVSLPPRPTRPPAQHYKVAVLGAAGGIGQPLSLLLKGNNAITHLSLYDLVATPGVAADLSHIPTKAKVSAGHGAGTRTVGGLRGERAGHRAKPWWWRWRERARGVGAARPFLSRNQRSPARSDASRRHALCPLTRARPAAPPYHTHTHHITHRR